jgi:uncharacterized lipoprotein YajG
MKKFIILLVVALTLLILSSCSSNPYSGKYVYNKDTTVNLNLDNDNTFSITETMGKFADISYGKYTINNNIIKLKFNETNVFNASNKILEGEVEGSRIVFKTVNGYFLK